MKRMNWIEAVTVCVGYSDFLAEAAKWNIPHFDNWIIVTQPDDQATRELCRKLNLHHVLTDDGKCPPGKGSFNKGRMIERGFQHGNADGWRIHIDADMVLGSQFRKLLEAAQLQEDHLYGIDRLMCKNWNDWQRVKDSGYLQTGHYDYKCRVGVPRSLGLAIGDRWAHPDMGYVPIGAFQMWHSSQDEWSGVRIKPYPSRHGNACRTDIQHGLQWDRHKRGIIPEILAVHLESEDSNYGVNWNGRKTRHFGPPQTKPVDRCDCDTCKKAPEDLTSDERRVAQEHRHHHKHHHHKHHHHHPHPYCRDVEE